MSAGDRVSREARLVDLARVRSALARLDGIARAHPELLGPPSPRNAAAWEAELRGADSHVDTEQEEDETCP